MFNNPDIRWVTKPFSKLSNDELYGLLRLRSDVFVMEQKCMFLDLDNNDQKAHHVFGSLQNEIIATTRLFKVGDAYEHYQSIGRVAGSSKFRNIGVGKDLMNYSIMECERLFGKGPIKIGAQLYLKKFYGDFGFEQAGEMYFEDEIEHIPMIRK